MFIGAFLKRYDICLIKKKKKRVALWIVLTATKTTTTKKQNKTQKTAREMNRAAADRNKKQKNVLSIKSAPVLNHPPVNGETFFPTQL